MRHDIPVDSCRTCVASPPFVAFLDSPRQFLARLASVRVGALDDAGPGRIRLRDRLLSAMGRCAVSTSFFKWGRLSASAGLRCSGRRPQAATLTCMVLRNRRRCDNCTNNGLLRTVSQLASSRKTFRKPQPRLWPARRARRAPRLARGKSRHCQSGTLRMSPTYQRLPSHDSPWTPRRKHPL